MSAWSSVVSTGLLSTNSSPGRSEPEARRAVPGAAHARDSTRDSSRAFNRRGMAGTLYKNQGPPAIARGGPRVQHRVSWRWLEHVPRAELDAPPRQRGAVHRGPHRRGLGEAVDGAVVRR